MLERICITGLKGHTSFQLPRGYNVQTPLLNYVNLAKVISLQRFYLMASAKVVQDIKNYDCSFICLNVC